MFAARTARHGTSKHSLLDPNFWTKPISARKSVAYTTVNLTALSNPCFGAWPGGGDCSYYTATLSDPVVNLYYIGAGTLYTNLVNGTWANSGNNGTKETAIRAAANQLWNSLPYNEYSKGTTAATPNVPTHPYKSRFTLPGGLTAYVPAAALPDPHPVGLMAIKQPDGSVLETMGTIVMSNGDLMTVSASFVNPRTAMDGSANGRRASLFPAHAGIVMNGEMTAQSIPHAVAINLAPSSIRNANPVYPAYAIDSGTSYTGAAGSGLIMGQMIAIPLATNLATAGLATTAGMTLATAFQTYGAVLCDTGGATMFGICSQSNASDIPAFSGPLASDIGIIRDLCKIVSSADFPF